MQELVISVTQAARTFADCVNRVRYQGSSFVLQKNGVPVARIVPVESTSGADLEQLAVKLHESRDEAPEDEKQSAVPVDSSEESSKIQQPSSSFKRPRLNW
jgi:prevent-host-death family protein